MREHSRCACARANPIQNHFVEVAAKTGTLNFVFLAGRLTPAPASGRDLAFAIFLAAMSARRATLTVGPARNAPTARDYRSPPRGRLQQQLIDAGRSCTARLKSQRTRRRLLGFHAGAIRPVTRLSLMVRH